MSNPTVSFRISDYHLARGLRAIRHLEPSWNLETTSDLIRTIFNDYIAKSEVINNDPLYVAPELLQEIALARSMVKQGQNNNLGLLPQIKKIHHKSAQQIERELKEERIFNELKRELKLKQEQIEKQSKLDSQDNDLDEQIKLSFQTERSINSALTKDLPTDSIINTVTEFSPPKEWTES